MKILVALDYSQSAGKVAETGYSLAKTMKADVILLHVMEDSTYYSILEYPPVKDFMGFSENEITHLFDKGSKEAMKQFLNKTAQYLGDTSIEVLLKEGEFAETILDCALNSGASIIVMGSHSRGWLRNMVIGSVTEKVLQHSTIPVFIVPSGMK